MADRKQQKQMADKDKKKKCGSTGSKQKWAEQSGKSPDDLEVFTEPRKL